MLFEEDLTRVDENIMPLSPGLARRLNRECPK